VEASVLETPAVSYMPVRSATYDYHLPNGLSHCAYTQDAVRELLGEILDGRRGLVEQSTREKLFNRHLTATQGPLACDRVVDVLVSNSRLQQAPEPIRPLPWMIAWVHGNLRTLVKRFNSRRSNHRNSAAYHDHRFPNISAAEVNARIARFSTLLKRFDGVRAEARSPYVFTIHDPEAARRLATSRAQGTARISPIEGVGAAQ
jgi:hypothetical protein